MRRGLGFPDGPERPARPASVRRPVRREAAKTPDENNREGEPLTVSELTRTVKSLLEGRIGAVTVTGEAAGLKPSPSGHVYFSLKDAGALVDCVIWRSTATRLQSLPKDGTKITLRGKLTVYEPRGRYQLVVSSIVADGGKGDLWRRFEELKERLAQEGLFNRERKKPLPDSPKTVGIVTSPTGAALRDILKILARRAPNLRVVVSPALVQGQGAAEEIAQAIARLEAWGQADVLIVGRGGGSLEDLWAFNEEPVARAIAAAATPVVSAVGHETDFTIADFVADARAATPSEAAECIAPDQSHLRGRLAHSAHALTRALSGLVRERREALRGVSKSRPFRRPEEMFNPRWQQLDDLHTRFADAMGEHIREARNRRDLTETRLRGLSPLKVLERGYAVVLDGAGRAVVSAEALSEGDPIRALLHKGGLRASVTAVEPE